jgi:hypothetical protein
MQCFISTSFRSPAQGHSTHLLLLAKLWNKQTPWPYYTSELYRSSDRRLSTNLVPTFVDREYRVVSATHPLRSYSRLSIPESLLFLPSSSSIVLSRLEWTPLQTHYFLEKSGSAANRTRDVWICRQELWPLGHLSGPSETTRHSNRVFIFNYKLVPVQREVMITRFQQQKHVYPAVYNVAACRPVHRQRPRNKQFYNSSC